MGGGVMRTAAKVGIAGGAAAARFRHAAPAFATAPSAEAAAAPLVSVAGAGEAPVAAGAQWAPLEVDDWEFADWRDAAEAEVVNKPRLVFAPPTREEAEEATSDLTDAIKRVYFSEAPLEVVKEQDQGLNKLKADAIIPSMPGHVAQAFTLLKASPEAQSVVASLAADKNVWEAVLKNEKVMDFYKTHQQDLVQTFPDDAATVESAEKLEDASAEDASPEELPKGSPFSDLVDNAKKKVMKVVDNITHFFQDMFRNPSESRSETSSSTENDSSYSFREMAAGGSFVALAIAVILVVLFKRS